MAKPTILLADRDPDATLETPRAQVIGVHDGATAIARALEADESDVPFALVLLALDLPGSGGLAVARALRKRGFTGPIVALTSCSSEPQEEECLLAGFDDYMSLPLTTDATDRLLKRHVRPAPRRSGVIPCVLVSEHANDEEMMEIVRPYVEGLPARATAIRSALAAGDTGTLRHLVLQLKGSGESYGFPSITEAAAAADRAVLSGDNPDKLRGRVEELCRLVSIARASVPLPSTRSESAVEPRGRERQVRRAGT